MKSSSDAPPIGHNGGPELDALQTHSEKAKETLSLIASACVATNEAQELALSAMLDEIRAAKKLAADDCEAEYRPHKAAGDAVKANYKPVQAMFDAAAAAVIEALTPYRTAKRKEAEALAQRKRDEAAKAQAEALAAIKASDDVEERFNAEVKLEQAAFLSATANKIERGATGLRTYWEAEITDRRAALNHYIKINPEAFTALIQDLADKDSRNEATRRDIAGIVFHERKRAI